MQAMGLLARPVTLAQSDQHHGEHLGDSLAALVGRKGDIPGQSLPSPLCISLVQKCLCPNIGSL